MGTCLVCKGGVGTLVVGTPAFGASVERAGDERELVVAEGVVDGRTRSSVEGDTGFMGADVVI
jgi:hypothetical protein